MKDKLKQEIAENLLIVLDAKERLRSLSNEELVKECLLTDAADYLTVEEMMTRLWPDWAKEEQH